MLAEAVSLGVVEFRIHHSPPRRSDLEGRINAAFPGVSAFVVESEGGELARRVGRLAASVCEEELSPGKTLGISYGRAVYETISAIASQQLSDVSVVQMAGVEGAINPEVNGWELVRLCADRLGANYLHLPAGLFSSTPELHAALLNDPRIANGLARAAAADIAIVGIGSMNPDQSSLVRAGHITPEELDKAVEAGSVGYICGRHYDANGVALTQLNELTMSLPLEDIAEIPTVIGVAYGAEKVMPMLGALRGDYLTAIVTDQETAEQIAERL
jgi:DNA-binding transcriptional regulator LsrR (DeoR family)